MTALPEALAAADAAGSVVTLILSNYYVRYAIVPWHAQLGDQAERLAYARHQFTKTYGEAAAQWALRVSGVVAGRARLASAIDDAFIEGLDTITDRAGAQLRSIQPLFMHAYNYWRQHIKSRNAWFAVAEPGKLCMGMLIGGEWQCIHHPFLREPVAVQLRQFLEQDVLLRDPAVAAAPVYLYAPDASDLLSPGDWTLTSLSEFDNMPPQPSHIPGSMAAGT